jgi:hypothetical protein
MNPTLMHVFEKLFMPASTSTDASFRKVVKKPVREFMWAYVEGTLGYATG